MSLLPRKSKLNNNKSGLKAAKLLKKREEAIARNEAYQKLSLEEKFKRNSKKVKAKLSA